MAETYFPRVSSGLFFLDHWKTPSPSEVNSEEVYNFQIPLTI